MDAERAAKKAAEEEARKQAEAQKAPEGANGKDAEMPDADAAPKAEVEEAQDPK